LIVNTGVVEPYHFELWSFGARAGGSGIIFCWTRSGNFWPGSGSGYVNLNKMLQKNPKLAGATVCTEIPELRYVQNVRIEPIRSCFFEENSRF
jgi:hypothetical protein